MDKIKKILDAISLPARRIFAKRILNKLKNILETEAMDGFLELLLKLIRLVIFINPEYKRNIKNFNARYTFKSKDGKIASSAIFYKDKMKVLERGIPDSNVTIIFKDGKSLWEFLMSDNPDVFSFVLDNKLTYEGNLNYLMKFGYMAKRLKLMFSF